MGGQGRWDAGTEGWKRGSGLATGDLPNWQAVGRGNHAKPTAELGKPTTGGTRP
jgi:hypothetical protein